MTSKRHLVLVGAGHAHLETIAALRDIISDSAAVTVMSLGAYQYYSGMGPGLLAGHYSPGQVRFNVKALVESRGARFVEERVTRINAGEKTLQMESGTSIPYDVASFNVGSVINTGPLEIMHDRMITVKPVERLFAARCGITRGLETAAVDVVVVGGGAAGVEIAANSSVLGAGLPNKPRVTLLTRGQILRQFPAAVRKRALKKLTDLGVTVMENAVVIGNSSETISIEGSADLHFDYALIATGTRPPALFQESGIPVGETGGLLVNEHLHSPQHPEIFGGGDCIDYGPRALKKVGVYAVRENPILLHNIKASLGQQPLESFEPQKHYHLALNMGDGSGISYRSPFIVSGKIAFKLKDYIDTAFMRRFQEFGEADEEVPCPPV